jgi:hypothetical protein
MLAIVTLLLILILSVSVLMNFPYNVNSQPANSKIYNGNVALSSIKDQSPYNATNDYYNKYYVNTLIDTSTNKTLNSANISEWKIDLSNNGWTFAQSWKQTIDNKSNIIVKYSDNGGRNYTSAFNVCPGGIDKRTGIYGPEFWVLCVRPTSSGHNNIYLVETRTGRTPLKSLTDLSINKNADSTILDFSVNGGSGSVVATWLETSSGTNSTKLAHPTISDPAIPTRQYNTYCYRC